MKTAKQAIQKSMDQVMAEQATGIVERAPEGGPFYDDKGNKVSDTAAKHLFRNGKTVALPNAGAGTYRTAMERLGYKKVELFDSTSSAGDWTLELTKSLMVSQSNRYPHCGFNYMLFTCNETPIVWDS